MYALLWASRDGCALDESERPRRMVYYDPRAERKREREKESWSGQSQFAKDADVQRCTYNTGLLKRQHRKSEEEVHSKMENGRKKGGARERAERRPSYARRAGVMPRSARSRSSVPRYPLVRLLLCCPSDVYTRHR